MDNWAGGGHRTVVSEYSMCDSEAVVFLPGVLPVIVHYLLSVFVHCILTNNCALHWKSKIEQCTVEAVSTFRGSSCLFTNNPPFSCPHISKRARMLTKTKRFSTSGIRQYPLALANFNIHLCAPKKDKIQKIQKNVLSDIVCLHDY